MVLKFLAGFLLLTAISSAEPPSLDGSVFSAGNMTRYTKLCVKVPSLNEMKSEVNTLLSTGRANIRPGKLERFLALIGMRRLPNAKMKAVSLDGMLLKEISPYDLEVISHLTMHRTAYESFWKDGYPIDQKEKDGVLYIERKCRRGLCRDRGLSTPVDLLKFNSTPSCQDASCAAEKIFGSEKAIYILWVYLKFGSNISPFSNINADPSGFDTETTKALIAAFQATPDHLREPAIENNGFYRFIKGSTLALYGEVSVIANAEGAVFDLIDQYDFAEKVGVFSHELGHHASHFGDESLDKSKGWRTASATDAVSTYGKTNPAEDFAETYLLYRFQPEKLKRLSPSRYFYMKKQVFKDIEYDTDLCNGRVNQSASTDVSPATQVMPSTHVSSVPEAMPGN